jgi:O-antigen/teichoic acid export membrane protein
MWLIRVPVAHALHVAAPNGVFEILTAAGVWILVSIDRGLLQASRDYTDLSINLAIEATVRCVLTVGLAKQWGVEGAALGVLLGELVTAVHARVTSTRATARNTALATNAGPAARTDPAATADPAASADPATRIEHGEPEQQRELALEQAVGDERAGAVVATAVHGGKDLAADVMVSLGSLLLMALLQNLDVIILGAKQPSHRDAYAAISVPSKALVLVALVLVNYLLPEAAIRHQRGSHALKQLAHTFAVMAVPCLVLLGIAVVAPRGLLTLVFGHRYVAAAPAFSSLVLAMIFMSVTVALTIYLLGIGFRWVVLVLALGAGALAAAAAAAAGGQYTGTARADLAVQVGLCAVMLMCFVVVHRRGSRRRAEAGDVPSVAPGSVARP